MISKTLLLIALCCAYATSLTPLAATEDDCALYLTGPGRSSAYDYNLNLLKGNFGYDGQHTCITYDAINQAYLDARTRILVSQPKGDWGPEDFASVGELILDISISLARTYGLNYEEIEKGLPLIDTSRTLIREVCPPVFSHVECRAGKYRRLDGLCNNLKNPTWGATMAPFQRLIGPLFADGINAPRISHTGRDLPLSRVVSRTMHPDEGFHDHAGTVMVIAWGQFMDHDYTLTGTPLDPTHRNDPEECCKRPPHLKHPYCNEIRVPDDDYFYRLFGVKCIDFVRGFPSPRPGCRLGSRSPFNTLTGALDGNTVYGVTDKFSRKLRTGYGGLLRMNPVFKEYGLKDLLPLKLDIPEEGCTRPNKNMYCFEAGEIRVNEQLVLTVMHTLMAREHNRVAEALAAVNPHWDDETLFQEARRINIAEIQHITYNEFLPILLGKDVMEKFGLVLEKEGYWDGYDTTVNPDVIAGFAAAAYRFGHSLLPTAVERWSKAHKFIASKRLSDLIRRPFDLYRAGVLDEYVMGLMNQVAQAMDDSITQEVTNHLFKKVGARFGMDLVSFNMQRGREFGLPGYMEFRKFCGLSGADSFQDLFGSMANETVRRYETIFEHPVDVDLWSGGVSERPLPGSMLGPTFACVIATQFSYSRRGDRFWFELPNQPSSFTQEQLREIRKSRLARVICDNTDIIDTVQLYPMVLPDHELNPRVPCRSGIIPAMDFSKWAEPAPFVNAAKEYMTQASIKNYTSASNEIITNCLQTNASNEEMLHKNETAIPKPQCNEERDTFTTNLTQNCTVNMTENNNNNVLCDNTTTDNLLESNKKHNNSDTLLKYIYKNKQKDLIPKKNTGYFQNSLQRKKRSHGTSSTVSEDDNKAPANFDYTSIHNSKDREDLDDLQLKPGIINSANLANFNIETLHVNNAISERKRVPAEGEYQIKSSKPVSEEEDTSYSEEHINEEKRSKDYARDNEDSSANKSLEESDEGNENTSLSQNSPGHSNEEYSSPGSSENIKDSYGNKNSESKESYYSKTSDEKENKKDAVKNHVQNSIQENSSSEESNESNEKEQYTNNVNADSHPNIHNKSEVLKEADVDDFSFERIRVNGKGQVETSQQSNENINITNEKATVTKSDNKPEKIKQLYLTSVDDPFSLKSDEDKKQIGINDEEVKPVIELNSENKSEESSEEFYDKPQNDGLNNENEEHKKLQKIAKSVDDKKVDVKQQFERIPLNYNYVDKTKNIDDTPQKSDAHDTDSNSNEDHDASSETPSPENHNFDDKLNIKFSDITIKLPEIKLPEDILDYATEVPELPIKDNEETKNRFYHYDGDNSQERSNKKTNEADFNDDSYGYFNNKFNEDDSNVNEKLKQRNDDYDDEDLYEKFVRERFGKRGSFNKRSENLKYAKPVIENKQLYQSLQNVLKKTEQIQKESDSDPKGGYLWTLEYGE